MQTENRLNSLLKKVDIYGEPISLKYNNAKTYKTAFGGFITVTFILGMLAYFIVLLMKIIHKESVVSFKSTFLSSAGQDIQTYNLTM
jgi:hypothetical protein